MNEKDHTTKNNEVGSLQRFLEDINIGFLDLVANLQQLVESNEAQYQELEQKLRKMPWLAGIWFSFYLDNFLANVPEESSDLANGLQTLLSLKSLIYDFAKKKGIKTITAEGVAYLISQTNNVDQGLNDRFLRLDESNLCQIEDLTDVAEWFFHEITGPMSSLGFMVAFVDSRPGRQACPGRQASIGDLIKRLLALIDQERDDQSPNFQQALQMENPKKKQLFRFDVIDFVIDPDLLGQFQAQEVMLDKANLVRIMRLLLTNAKRAYLAMASREKSDQRSKIQPQLKIDCKIIEKGGRWYLQIEVDDYATGFPPDKTQRIKGNPSLMVYEPTPGQTQWSGSVYGTGNGLTAIKSTIEGVGGECFFGNRVAQLKFLAMTFLQAMGIKNKVNGVLGAKIKVAAPWV